MLGFQELEKAVENGVELHDLILRVAVEHHEKFDGSGYPNGLKGEDIHIYGRITAIADVFDALGSARVYKPRFRSSHLLR